MPLINKSVGHLSSEAGGLLQHLNPEITLQGSHRWVGRRVTATAELGELRVSALQRSSWGCTLLWVTCMQLLQPDTGTVSPQTLWK